MQSENSMDLVNCAGFSHWVKYLIQAIKETTLSSLLDEQYIHIYAFWLIRKMMLFIFNIKVYFYSLGSYWSCGPLVQLVSLEIKVTLTLFKNRKCLLLLFRWRTIFFFFFKGEVVPLWSSGIAGPRGGPVSVTERFNMFWPTQAAAICVSLFSNSVHGPSLNGGILPVSIIWHARQG